MALKIKPFKYVWFLFLCLPLAAMAQFTGPTSPSAGVNTNYTYNDGSVYVASAWVITNGTVISFSSSGTTYSVTVQWTAPGSGSLTLRSKANTISSLNVFIPYGLAGGGYFCSGGSGVSVTLNGSDANHYFQLYKNGVAYGASILGTGSAITWNNLNQEGTYTAKTTDGFPMSGSPYVGVSSLPTIFAVSGGGSFCSGGSGVPISLLGSETNIGYQLLNGGASVGSMVAGNGGTMSWGNQTTPGTYTIVAYNEQGCFSTMTGSATIIKSDLPTISNAGSNTTICANGNTTLGANGPFVGTGAWTVTSGPSTSAAQFSSTINPAAVFTPAGGAGNYVLTWTISNAPCAASSSSVTVTVIASPTTSNAGSNRTICANSNTTLGANAPTVGTGVWTVLSGPSTSTTQFSSTTNAAAVFTPAGGAGNYVLTWTINNAPCAASSSNVTVTVSALPTTSNAGSNRTICANGNTTLGANAPTIGTGAWTVTSGPSTSTAQFSSTTNPAAVFTPASGAGTYVLTWTISNAPCAASSSSVTVTVSPLPTTANAGSNQSICVTGNAVLAANAPTVGTGAWTIASGPSTATTQFNSTTNRAATFTPSGGAGTYVLTWTISNSPCASSSSNVTITVNALPTTANAGPGQSGAATCGLTTVTLAANTPTVGVGSWSVVTGTGGSFGNTSSPTSTFSGTAGATYTLKWTITNGVCTSSSSNVSVTLNRNPTTSNAGSGQGIWGSGSVTLSANAPTVGTAAWSIVSGPNSSMSQFSNSTSSASTFTPAGGAGNYVLSWTVSASPCPSSSSNVTISVLTVPVITAPQTAVIKGSNITMDAGPGYSSYSWRNSVNAQVATTQTYATNVVDSYRVIVTKSGYTSLPSQPFTLTSQLAGMNMNYIVTNTVLVNNITDSNVIANLPVDQANQSISYFDGLGRPIQNVITQGSPLKSDIVQSIVYDEFGRESKKYLPLVNGSNGWYKSDPVGAISGNYPASMQYQFYNNGIADKITDDTRPFNETIFEASPLNRPSQDFGPGQNWKDNNKYVYHQYLVNNSSTEQIIAWDVSTGVPLRSTVSNAYTSGGYYTTGQLDIKSTKDEQGNEVREYIDKAGLTILKKVQAVTSPSLLDVNSYTQTYYIYDAFGQLTYVLQPELVKALVINNSNPTTSDLANFAFQYKYDSRHRMVTKRVPGADSVFMVYDLRDRLVMTQDGNQRPNNEWLVTKYDSLNRPVMTAIYLHSANIGRVAMSSLISTSKLCEYYSSSFTSNHGYSSNVFPKTNLTVLTVSYYDNYNFRTDLTEFATNYGFANTDISGQETSNNAQVQGHPTGGKINVLGTTSYLKSIVYYDVKYRKIQTIADNNKGGWDRTTSLLDFTGRVLNTKTTHHTSTHSDQTIARRFVVDHAGRVRQIFHKVNSNQEILLSSLQYNEIGQLVEKNLHSTDGGSTFKQSLDARYNIRGWLTSINNSQLTNDGGTTNDDNNDLFGIQFGYNNDLGTGSTPQYNNNISAVKWSKNLALGAAKDAAYNFTYDAMSRITGASYITNTSNVWSNATSAFSESGYTYDANGNVMGLTRKGVGGSNMDILSYTYNGNQLMKVDDTGDKTKGFVDGANTGNDFAYDVNGNMTADNNKGITSITYNHMNFPVQVTKNTYEKMIYTYDATGKKLSQQVYSAGGALIKTTDYVGDFIYQNDTLQFINNADGRVVMKTGTQEYQYHLKDHWGNVRVTFTSQATAKTYTAGFETANQTTEASNFSNYPTGAKINTVAANAHSGSNSLYLNGSASGGQIGVTKSFSVMPGDQVSIQAYAKYNAPTSTQSNLAGFAAALLSAFNLSAPVSGETGTARSAINAWGAGEAAAFGDGTTDQSDPKVFVNILVFDRNFNFLDISYQQLTSNGVMNAIYTVKQAGHVYVYVSNEQPVLTDVYFDDITITYTPSLIVQQEDFYPFGLTFDSYQRQSTIPNKFLFHNKTEFIDDIGLNWYHFRYRMEDPALGRFMCVDPLAEKYVYNSPYAFGENKLGMGIELEGLELAPWDNTQAQPAPGWHAPLAADPMTVSKTTTATQSTTTVTNTRTGESTSTVTNRVYDMPGGKNIPSNIATVDKDKKASNVAVSFQDTQSDKHGSNNKIPSKAADGFVNAVKIFAGMKSLNSVTVTATTNGNHSTSILPLPNWNNPNATSNHYAQNGGTGIDVGAINGVAVASLDSATRATWRVAMDSAGAKENLGPWTGDKEHQNHIHNSFK